MVREFGSFTLGLVTVMSAYGIGTLVLLAILAFLAIAVALLIRLLS